MKYIIFDLDGTLSDSREGIINAYLYAFSKCHIEISDEMDLLSFIGPPIMKSFVDTMGMSYEEATICNRWFQDYYSTSGLYENVVYDGIRELLRSLKNQHCVLGVATSKPEAFAREILDYFQLSKYFNVIKGATMDDSLSKKVDILQLAIAEGKEKYPHISRIVMVGDRLHDMEAAKELGVEGIGVTYGFGSFEELKDAGATYICNTAQEVENIIIHKE